ncbi:MAG: hypothetical protein ACTSVV_03495 [Promethearchaeota archaeon]
MFIKKKNLKKIKDIEKREEFKKIIDFSFGSELSNAMNEIKNRVKQILKKELFGFDFPF